MTHTAITRGEAIRRFSGLVPYDRFVSDGCTWAPDRAINGADLSEACRWHDYAYTIGGGESDRKTADRNLRYNMSLSGCPWWACQFYYHRVRFWGVHHFAYHHPAKPPTLRHWISLLWTRYVT